MAFKVLTFGVAEQTGNEIKYHSFIVNTHLNRDKLLLFILFIWGITLCVSRLFSHSPHALTTHISPFQLPTGRTALHSACTMAGLRPLPMQ